MLINYTANADFLGNLYSSKNVETGIFVGVGLGGTSYIINANSSNANLDFVSITAFDVGINFGLRSHFNHNHAVEFAARVPFLPFAKYDSDGIKISIRQAFSIMMRYVYVFGDAPQKQAKKTIKKRKKIIKNRKSK